MQYSFRLAELLKHEPDPRKRPGTIKAIVEYTGLDRHQVAALLKNEIKYIPLQALSSLCDYLIENGFASADELPGALFSIEPERFWDMLARRRRMEMCLGVRRDMESEEAGLSFVSASDSVLMGEILSGVTTLGGTATHSSQKRGRGGSAGGVPSDKQGLAAADTTVDVIPQPEHWIQSLVWSPGQQSDEKVMARATGVYKTFSASGGDKALVCLGSNKSNPVAEILFSNAFVCDPFVSQDGVDEARQRSCPFYIRYRENDPQPASCLAGNQLSKSEKSDRPGIYYEGADGKWILANEKGDSQFVGFLFYAHRESLGRLELSLGGFSGKATRELAKLLATRADAFWPWTCNESGVQVGAFIIEFDEIEGEDDGEILQSAVLADSRVVRIPEDAIKRRL